MSRYTGSINRKSRRLHFSLLENNKEFLKGKKREYAPGQPALILVISSLVLIKLMFYLFRICSTSNKILSLDSLSASTSTNTFSSLYRLINGSVFWM